MNDFHRHPDTPDPRVPERLADALRDLDADVPVTTRLDARVRDRASSLAEPARLPWRHLTIAGGALAAGLALAVVFWPQLSQPRSATVNTQAVAGDIDRDGKVTILDAYLVARGVDSAQTDPAWDANSDGAVNLADADALATIAVRLGTDIVEGGAG